MPLNTQAASGRLRRLLTVIALGVAIPAGIALPVLVGFTGYAGTRSTVFTDAALYADRLSEIAQREPEMWQFLNHRLEAALLSWTPGARGARVEVFSGDGLMVLARGDHPRWPVLTGSALLEDGYDSVGMVKVAVSLWPVLMRTLLAAGAGLLVIGVLLFALLRLPFRVLDQTMAELNGTYLRLRDAEVALRRSQKMDAIGQLSGGIAHDFNNILNIIQGHLEQLSRELPGGGDAARRVDTIRRAAQRAADLVRRLLGYSARKTQRVETVDINALVEGLGQLIDRSVTPEVCVEYLYGHGVWPVAIDPGEFEDTLLNLVLNARDAVADRGHIVIETGNRSVERPVQVIGRLPEPGDYVCVSVSDNGRGLADDALEHIFEPFFTTKDPGRGTGLGLSMVYGFVERCGGFIDVESAPGKGSVFRVFLPRAVAALSAMADSAPAPAPPRSGRETILIVDDEPELLEITAEALEQLGYRTLTAATADEALGILRAGTAIDLVLSDVVMPGGMNGFQLVETVAARFPGIRSVLMSGYTGGETQTTGRERAILRKPFTETELAAAIRDALDAETATGAQDSRATKEERREAGMGRA